MRVARHAARVATHALLAASCTRADGGVMGDVAGLDCTYDAGLPVSIFECRTRYNACYNTCEYSAQSTVYAHSWMGAEDCFQSWVHAFVPAQDVTFIGCIPSGTLEPGERPNVVAEPRGEPF